MQALLLWISPATPAAYLQQTCYHLAPVRDLLQKVTPVEVLQTISRHGLQLECCVLCHSTPSCCCRICLQASTLRQLLTVLGVIAGSIWATNAAWSDKNDIYVSAMRQDYCAPDAAHSDIRALALNGQHNVLCTQESIHASAVWCDNDNSSSWAPAGASLQVSPLLSIA
jgi:hypothetical protein